MATRTKKTTKKRAAEPERNGGRRGKAELPKDFKPPETFLGQLIGQIVFDDTSLEDADNAVGAYLDGLSEKQLETIGHRVLPLTARLVSVAPHLSAFFQKRVPQA